MARRLAAILAADVVGFSRLMGADETGTLERLKSLRKELVQPKITAHGGRIVKLMGDGLLAEFSSVVEAVQCAVEIQEGVAEMDPDLPQDRRIQLRIGVNLGDIIIEGNDIYGDGVNVAARLEGLAEPRGICLSWDAYRQVRGKLDVRFEDLGERRVKNIAEPLRVYRIIVGSKQTDKIEAPFEAKIGLDFSIPDYPSIAVLPFTVMGNDPEQEFFAGGVAEDIITALSKISRLLVVARNSSFTYKGKAVDVKRVSREQGVRYVLEGSVRKAGNRVRVTAQLIDATTGLHLWAERYDRELEDIFAVQDEITREIVVAMDVQLREGEQHRVWSRGTRNLEAWECVRLATDDVLGGSADKQPTAKELVERALALDPDYAIAWAMRGWLYFNEADVGGGIGTEEQFDKAQAAAFRCGRRALQADPQCAEAYGVLALTHLNAGEHDAAIEMTEKAIALAPNSPEILGGVASAVMRKSGRPDRGAECVKKAMRLSPFYRPGLLRALGNNYRLSGRLEEAVACYRESLKRETGYLAAYVNLASALGELGWLDEARQAAREVLQQDPDFSISGYAKGLSYRNPSDLQRIADGLRQAGLPEGDDALSPDAKRLELPDKPSIGVLPFTNMSGDPAQEHLADGIAEDIITALSKVSNLFVVARNSTFAYRGKAIDIKQVGREQGVRYVLEGSVQRSGQRLRVTAQLIDAASGHHIWAQRYDRVVEDIFEVQDEITREVTSALQVQLTEGEQARLWAGGTKNLEAWEAAIQCPELLHSHRRVDVLPARRLAKRALELDEDYASAWVMLGWSYWNEVFNGWTDDPDATLELAVDAFNRARAIDDTNPDALALLAFLHISLKKYDEARHFIEKAMALGPNNSFAPAVAANIELFCNRPEAMVPLLKRAMRLSPIYPAWYLGDLAFAYLLMDRLDDAIATAKESIKIDPDYIYNYQVLAVAHAELRQAEAARTAVENILRIEPKMSIRTFRNSLPYEDEALLDRMITAFRKAGLPE